MRYAIVLLMTALAGIATVPVQAVGEDKAKPNVPKEATGFVGTLVGTVVKPPPADNPTWFTFKVAKVVSYAPNNKVKLSTDALTKLWQDTTVALLMVKNMPPLKAGDSVTVTAYQFEVHLRAAGPVKVNQPEPPKPADKTPPKVMSLPKGVKAIRDIEYAKVGEKSLLLDIYTPEEAKKPLPLIVWIHGGAWRGGSKDNPYLLGFATQGYIVASINYRHSQEAIYPAQIEDCKGAIRFLRANAKKYAIDADHIGAAGDSAGGHLVALLGASGGAKELEGAVGGNLSVSSRVQGVVDYFGVSDMNKFKGQPVWPRVDQLESPLCQLVGGLLADKQELVAKANPITFITKNCPPFLVAHGDKDDTVPFNQSELLVEALKKAGVEVTFEVVKGAKHGLNWPQFKELNPKVAAFFDKCLKPAASQK